MCVSMHYYAMYQIHGFSYFFKGPGNKCLSTILCKQTKVCTIIWYT